MDGSRFDALTRTLASGRTRRGLLGALAGAALGSLGLTRTGEAAKCRAASNVCSANSDCCSGACITVSRGKKICRCNGDGDCPAPGVCQASTCAAGLCVTAATPGAVCGNGGVCTGSTCCQPEPKSTNCPAGTCGSQTNNCGQPVDCGAAPQGACTNVSQCCNAAASVCSSNVCLITTGGPCSVNADCVSHVCVDGICVAGLVPDGGVCDEDADCLNGHCCSGICRNFATDPDHCNSCTNVCPAGANSSANCASGVCGIVCDPGYADCNGNAANGCEIDTTTDTDNCGACNAPCDPGDVCENGVCRTPGPCEIAGTCGPTCVCLAGVGGIVCTSLGNSSTDCTSACDSDADCPSSTFVLGTCITALGFHPIANPTGYVYQVGGSQICANSTEVRVCNYRNTGDVCPAA